jgi:hypothetical protein
MIITKGLIKMTRQKAVKDKQVSQLIGISQEEYDLKVQQKADAIAAIQQMQTDKVLQEDIKAARRLYRRYLKFNPNNYQVI